MKDTKHAKTRAVEKSITENMISEAILQPSQTYYDLSTGTTIVFKKLNEKHLLVAYSKEDSEIKIVTTFITSDAQEIISRKLGKTWVKVEYDRESDILYIKFKDAEIVDTKMLSEDAYIDLDKDGNLVGIEIWKASQNAILPISKDIAEKLKLILENPA